MATKTDSKVKEMMWLIQVTTADMRNKPQGTECYRGFSLSVIYTVILLLFLLLDVSRLLLHSTFSQENVDLYIYHLDAHTHKIKPDFSKFFLGNLCHLLK